MDKEARQVSKEEGAAWAARHGMLFIEASAKTKFGVQQVFQEVIQKILETPELLVNTAPRSVDSRGGRTTNLNQSQNDNNGGTCC